MRALRRRLRQAIARLYPGYFALVMATGIVSLAADALGMSAVARILYVANVAFAAILILALALRLMRSFTLVVADLTTHQQGPAFFTLVAALCVLGIQVLEIQGAPTIATVLWFVAAFLWLILVYAFFTAIVVRNPKPDLGAGLTGAWLIVVVSTESLSILATLLASRLPGQHDVWWFGALVSFLLGAVLFVFITVLVFYRFTFFAMTPRDLSPLYWVNMGAAAITCLAGTTLVVNAPRWPILPPLAPALLLGALAYWVLGSWWIPLLVVLSFWRHAVKRFPLSYTPRFWGVVFPLGMYTDATLELARATGLAFLATIARFAVYVALAAWLVTALAMVRQLISTLALGYAPAWPGRERRRYVAPPRSQE